MPRDAGPYIYIYIYILCKSPSEKWAFLTLRGGESPTILFVFSTSLHQNFAEFRVFSPTAPIGQEGTSYAA